jgi:hypothetical protein
MSVPEDPKFGKGLVLGITRSSRLINTSDLGYVVRKFLILRLYECVPRYCARMMGDDGHPKVAGRKGVWTRNGIVIFGKQGLLK